MNQVWKFIDKIFDTNNFAAVPICFWVTNSVLRVYSSSRNNKNESIPIFFDFDFLNKKIITIPKRVGINLGELGSFDDSGVMPTSIIKVDDQIYMYYIGWNLGVTVPFRNSIGLAVSSDNGETFIKKYKGPILDRTKDEPHFVASNHVVFHEGVFKMWYLSCVKWEKKENEIRHFYHIKYATSNDGINWERNNWVAIDFIYENEYAISVPRVILEDGIFKMWYSYRGGLESSKYRIGYAESFDGKNWTRKDDSLSFILSGQNWDNDMICYPFVFSQNKTKYMLYNGNDYGKKGIGLFQLQ
jgi:hypothetical protein